MSLYQQLGKTCFYLPLPSLSFARNLSVPLFLLSLSTHSGVSYGVNNYFGNCGQSRKREIMLYHMIDGLF